MFCVFVAMLSLSSGGRTTLLNPCSPQFIKSASTDCNKACYAQEMMRTLAHSSVGVLDKMYKGGFVSKSVYNECKAILSSRVMLEWPDSSIPRQLDKVCKDARKVLRLLKRAAARHPRKLYKLLKVLRSVRQALVRKAGNYTCSTNWYTTTFRCANCDLIPSCP